MAFVGSLFPLVQIRDGNGVPGAGWKVESFIAGETPPTTHKFLFEDALCTVPLTDPAIYDSDGNLVAFCEAGAYDFFIYDADDVLQFSIEGYEDFGGTFLSSLGTQLNAGARSVTSGYTVLATDLTITVNSTGGANPCVINMPAAALHPQPLTIKNVGTIALSVVPNGTETVELGAAGVAYSVPAAASPAFPTISLTNDATSAWLIYGSHKCP